jgi:hypothetical protein
VLQHVQKLLDGTAKMEWGKHFITVGLAGQNIGLIVFFDWRNK